MNSLEEDVSEYDDNVEANSDYSSECEDELDPEGPAQPTAGVGMDRFHPPSPTIYVFG